MQRRRTCMVGGPFNKTRITCNLHFTIVAPKFVATTTTQPNIEVFNYSPSYCRLQFCKLQVQFCIRELIESAQI